MGKRYLANVIRTARLPPLGEVRHILQYDDGEVESLDLAQERFKVVRVVHTEGGTSENVATADRVVKAPTSLKVVLRGAGGLAVQAEHGPILGKRQRKLTPAMAKMKQEQQMKQMIKQQKNGGGRERVREEEQDPAVDDSLDAPSPPLGEAFEVARTRPVSKRESKKLALKKQDMPPPEVPVDRAGISTPQGSTPRKLLRPKRVTRTPRRLSSGDFVELEDESGQLFEPGPPEAPTQPGAEHVTLADLAGLAAAAQVQPPVVSPHQDNEVMVVDRRMGRASESERISAAVEWLQQGPFQEYAPLFAYHRVTWDVLPYLTRDDLRDMGIHLVGPRRALLMALHGLQKANKTTPRKTRRGFR